MSSDIPSLESLFTSAIQKRSRQEMLAHVDSVQGANSELKAQVKQLIEAHCATAQSFMGSPAVGVQSELGKFAETMDVKPEAMEAGLSAAFTEKTAVVVGGTKHSVLESLSRRMGSKPSINLKDDPSQRSQTERPNSKEIPKTDGDSRYQIHGEIAQGGMGAVLKGRDIDLGRDLAIKVLLDRHKDNPEHIERFVEEAQIGGQLQHPGIAPIYELGQFEDERPFFTMKLVKGETLAAILAKRKAPAEDIPKLVGIFEQICQTMAYAHSKGVIHRDLKPANIMVGAFGEVQVMDWGLSKVLQSGGVADERKSIDRDVSIVATRRSTGSEGSGIGSDTMDGSIMGTPAYMPPEQAHGETDRLDTRSDVFGLGAILAQILTGSPAYIAESNSEVLRLARRANLDDCYQRLDASSADAELKSICKQALSAEPIDRHHDASELSAEITAYLEGVQDKLKETELARVEAETRTEEEKKRKRLYLGAAGLIACALVVTVGMAVMLKNSRDKIEKQNLIIAEEKLEAERARDLAEAKEIRARSAEDQARQAAERESRERLRLQLRRLADKSRELRETKRPLSVLLAIEAIKLAKANNLWPLPDAHAALLEATIDLGGIPAPFVHGAWFTKNKNREVIYSFKDRTLSVRTFGVRPSMPTGLEIPLTKNPGNVQVNFDGTRIAGLSERGTFLWTLNDEATSIVDQKELEGVNVLGLSLDAKMLVGEADGQLLLWRDPFETNGNLGEGIVVADKKRGSRVQISQDGRWLVQHSGEIVQLWNLNTDQTPESVQSIENSSNARDTVAFSEDGRWLLVGGEVGKNDLLLDLSSENPTQNGHRLDGAGGAWNPTRMFAFSGDSQWLCLSGETEIQLYRLEAEGPVLHCLLTGPQEHLTLVHSVGFSPDSHWLATGETINGEEFAVRLWDLSAIDRVEMQPAPLLGQDGQYRSVPLWRAQFSGDQHTRLLVTAMDNHVSKIFFSSDSRWLDAQVGPYGHTFWDLQDPLLTKTQLLTPENPYSVEFSPQNDRLAVGNGNGTAKIYQLIDGIPQADPIELDCEHENRVVVNFSDDGRWLMTSTAHAGESHRGIEIWDLQDSTAPRHKLTGIPEIVKFAGISPTGRFVVADLRDGFPDAPILYCWDLESGQPDKPKQLNGHTARVMLMEFGDDDTELFTGGEDGTLVCWDLSQEEPTYSTVLDTKDRLETADVVWGLQKMQHGWRIASNLGEEGHLWDLSEDFELIDSSAYQAKPLYHRFQKFSSDGRWCGDQTVWDSEKQLRVAAHAHKQAGWCAEFSPTNNFYATIDGAGDSPIYVSYLPSGETMRIDGKVGRNYWESAEFSPDGRWLAIANQDWGINCVRLFEMDENSAILRGKQLVGRELTESERIEFGIPVQ